MENLKITFDKSGLEINSIAISAMSGLIFFVVAHPFLFNFVDNIISNLIDIDKVPSNVLLLIHSLVFIPLMYILILTVINFL